MLCVDSELNTELQKLTGGFIVFVFQGVAFESKPKKSRSAVRDVDVEQMARSNQVRTHTRTYTHSHKICLLKNCN